MCETYIKKMLATEKQDVLNNWNASGTKDQYYRGQSLPIYLLIHCDFN